MKSKSGLVKQKKFKSFKKEKPSKNMKKNMKKNMTPAIVKDPNQEIISARKIQKKLKKNKLATKLESFVDNNEDYDENETTIKNVESDSDTDIDEEMSIDSADELLNDLDDANENDESTASDVDSSSDEDAVVQVPILNSEQKEEKRRRAGVTVFVGNLPSNIKRPKLFKLFSKFGKIISIRLRTNNGQRFFRNKSKIKLTAPHLIAFVDFEKMENAKASLSLNGTKLLKNVLRVNLQADSKTNTNFDSSRTVFVGNLKYCVTDQIMHETFSCCGDIDYVRLLQCEKGCKGTAYVCFVNPSSVQLALDLNKTLIQNREIRVERYSTMKMDRSVKLKNQSESNTNYPNKLGQKMKSESDKTSKSQFRGNKTTKLKTKSKKKQGQKNLKMLARKIAPKLN